MQAKALTVVIAMPQALGCFGQQVPGEIRSTLIGAQIRLEHMLMAHAPGEAGGGRLDIDTVQHLVEQQAINPAPDPVQPHG
jgi:hypothetical protein